MNTAAVGFGYRAGETVQLQFAVTDQAGAVTDITGMTIIFVLSRRPGSTPVAQSNVSPATATATITNAAGGLYEVAVGPTVTQDLSGVYRFESWLIDTALDESVPAHGWIHFTPSLL